MSKLKAIEVGCVEMDKVAATDEAKDCAVMNAKTESRELILHAMLLQGQSSCRQSDRKCQE